MCLAFSCIIQAACVSCDLGVPAQCSVPVFVRAAGIGWNGAAHQNNEQLKKAKSCKELQGGALILSRMSSCRNISKILECQSYDFFFHSLMEKPFASCMYMETLEALHFF